MIKRLCKLNDWLPLVKDIVDIVAHFPCTVPSVSQKRKSYKTESHKKESVTPVQ